MALTEPPMRIALIHALAESVGPIYEAFAAEWPEALTFDVLDTSLARDLAAAGRLEQSMIERFLTLGRYAEAASGEGGRTAALLFTCSAFGRAIDAVKAAVNVPVLRPNEAAFEEALDRRAAKRAAASAATSAAERPGEPLSAARRLRASHEAHRIALLVTFAPSLPALRAELVDMAQQREVPIEIHAHIVDGALDALRRGDGPAHDRLIARAAARLPAHDCLVLGQFSMARAANAVSDATAREVLTTPVSAVRKLKRLLTHSEV